jgi:nucleoside 2-deoxyribosyltransferase
MNVYIAHNFVARDWLRTEIKPLVEAAGHILTSTWIWDDSHLHSKNSVESAVEDLHDVDRADSIILFTDTFVNSKSQGKGKFFELGYALRAGKRCILVGEDKSCIFYHLPNMRHVKTIEEALKLV